MEMSYIAGAGSTIRPFTLDECVQSGSTLTSNINLDPQVGGVIEETIPTTKDQIPSVADSVIFNVSCVLFSGKNLSPSQATLTVHCKCSKILQGIGFTSTSSPHYTLPFPLSPSYDNEEASF